MTQRLDKADPLCDADKLPWRYLSARRMVPGYQRLDAGHAAGIEIDLRLVVKLQLALIDRLAQFLLDAQTALGLIGKFRLVKHVAHNLR